MHDCGLLFTWDFRFYSKNWTGFVKLTMWQIWRANVDVFKDGVRQERESNCLSSLFRVVLAVHYCTSSKTPIITHPCQISLIFIRQNADIEEMKVKTTDIWLDPHPLSCLTRVHSTLFAIHYPLEVFRRYFVGNVAENNLSFMIHLHQRDRSRNWNSQLCFSKSCWSHQTINHGSYMWLSLYFINVRIYTRTHEA